MLTFKAASPRTAQAGGITIMVALMLLILLTIAAVGMSRNSFKEVVATGFMRQGAMAQNAADSGLEWSILWLADSNRPNATGSAKEMADLKLTLLQNSGMAGVAKDLHTGADYTAGAAMQDDLKLPGPTGYTQGFTLGLTSMGKMPITMTTQGTGPGAFSPASGAINKAAPDLWGIRSDAQVIQGGVTFIHARELWASTPVTQ
jgi:hypothetical protein